MSMIPNATMFIESLFSYSYMNGVNHPENITKETLLNASPKLRCLEGIWNYLREIKKYIPLTDVHENCFWEIYDTPLYNFTTMYKEDCNKLVMKYIHNSNLMIDTHCELSKTIITLPPAIFDFTKWAWIISVYNLAKSNEYIDYLKNKNTLVYNVPYNYFDNNYTASRFKVELAQLKYCVKLGCFLEHYLPDVYESLNRGLGIGYVPDISFGKNPVATTDTCRVCRIQLLENFQKEYVIQKCSESVHDTGAFATVAKDGCIKFVEKFKKLPTQKIIEVFNEKEK